MSRGALYMVWPGEERTEAALQRSIASLQAVHPELPYHVEVMPEGSTLLDKAKMYDLSPFDETLFLDADTVVLGRLDYGFRKARGNGIALCICECPWARRFNGLSQEGDIVEYNTGVIFFDKNYVGTKLAFHTWKQLAKTLDSRLVFMLNGVATVMPENDQASLALAIDQFTLNPFVLPLNWNFRPIWQKSVFGPVRVYHDYSEVPEYLLKWNEQQTADGAIIDCARTR